MGDEKKPKPATSGVWPTVKPFVNGGASGMLATCVIQPIDMIKVSKSSHLCSIFVLIPPNGSLGLSDFSHETQICVFCVCTIPVCDVGVFELFLMGFGGVGEDSIGSRIGC